MLYIYIRLEKITLYITERLSQHRAKPIGLTHGVWYAYHTPWKTKVYPGSIVLRMCIYH